MSWRARATRSRTSTRWPRARAFARCAGRSGSRPSASTRSRCRPATRPGATTTSEQEELYFVHRGRVEMTFDDGATHVLGPGGVARVDAATIRQVKNVGDEPAVYLVRGRQGRLRGARRQACRGRDEPLRRRGPRRAEPRCSAGGGRRRRARGRAGRPATQGRAAAGRRAVPGLPARQPLEPARRPAARAPNSDAIVRSIGARRDDARGLRLGPLRGRADRDPVHDGVGARSGGCR